MAKKSAKLNRLTEAEALDLFESIRWPEGAACPRCGSVAVTRLGGKAGEKGQWKCKEKECRKKFTVRVGTIFSDSPIPLRDWVYAFHRMCASKKGISAHQLHRELDITYKSAWFMCHRIRHAMSDDGSFKLGGVVESDESYIGGKAKNKHSKDRKKIRGHSHMKPVQVLVERDGRKVTRVIPNVKGHNLRRSLVKHVDPSAHIHTDENLAYRTATAGFSGHKAVNHSVEQYVKRDGDDMVTTNTAESSFAILKRGIIGTFHHVSKHHLQRYCDEFDFRWNYRKVDDIERTMAALAGAEGKRLSYVQPRRRRSA